MPNMDSVLAVLDVCEKANDFGERHNGYGSDERARVGESGYYYPLDTEQMVELAQLKYIEITTPSVPGGLPGQSSFFNWKITASGKSALDAWRQQQVPDSQN